MMRTVTIAAMVLVTALVACGRREAEQETPPVVEAPVSNTDIGFDAAAGIASALPMSVEAIQAAAPNFIVAAVQDQVEGQSFTAITLSAGDEEVFRVLPTSDGRNIHAIVTISTQARGPNDEIVGQSKFAAAPAEETAFCMAESVDGAPGFACSSAGDGRFWRVYRLPEAYDGPSDPFDAIDPDVLHDATLAEMRWIAPRVTAE
jgi:hypothetical protein